MSKVEEVFGVDIDVDGNDLIKKLTPSGISMEAKKDCAAAMLDVVSLPGKMTIGTDADDTASNIQNALHSIVNNHQRETLDFEVPRDLKWMKGSQNALRTVSSLADLQEMTENVIGLQETAMKHVYTMQKIVLQRDGLSLEVVEAWAYGGYISCISRKTLTLYVSFLHHLRQVAVDLSWTVAKKEIDYYLKKINLLRANTPTRLATMCKIYVLFRDAQKDAWRVPKLESEKLTELYQLVGRLTSGGDSSSTGAGVGMLQICSKCSTVLHGDAPCPWSAMNNTRARKAAREFMRRGTDGAGEDGDGG
jgi:hypothetical protein